MRTLFELDEHDYDLNGTIRKRPSARGIMIRDGKIAMIYSKKYGFYKFPGGGIEQDEDMREARVLEMLIGEGYFNQE